MTQLIWTKLYELFARSRLWVKRGISWSQQALQKYSIGENWTALWLWISQSTHLNLDYYSHLLSMIMQWSLSGYIPLFWCNVHLFCWLEKSHTSADCFESYFPRCLFRSFVRTFCQSSSEIQTLHSFFHLDFNLLVHFPPFIMLVRSLFLLIIGFTV